MSKSIKKNALAKLALNILNVVLPFITGPYLARTLDKNLYGEFNAAFSIVSWFIPFASFGIYNYGIRVISQIKHDKKKTEAMFTSLFSMGLMSTIAVLIIYFIYVFLIPDKANTWLYTILSIQIVANIFMVEWMNEAFESYGFILFKTMAVRIINVISILVFIKNPDDILKYALINSLILLINNLASYVYIKRNISFQKIEKSQLKSLIRPLFVMLLLANANMFYTYLDKLFLSIFADKVYVTYYTFSQSITGLIGSVINAVIIVTIPRLSLYIGQKNDKEYKNLLYSSSRIFFMIGIPMCIGLSVMAKPIMLLYGGEQYIGAGLTMSLFAFRYLLGLCDLTLANQVIFIHGKENLLTKMYFIGGGINLVLNSLLVVFKVVRPELLVITTFMSEIVLISMMISCVRKIDSTIHVLNKTTLRYFLTAMMFYPIGFGISKVMGLEYIINIKFIIIVAVIVMTCVIFYFVVLLLFKDEALLQLLDMVLGKVKHKFRRGKK